MKQEQINAAANHFVELYGEEIMQGETITGSSIHEWWNMTVEQYPTLDRDDFEAIKTEIFGKIEGIEI